MIWTQPSGPLCLWQCFHFHFTSSFLVGLASEKLIFVLNFVWFYRGKQLKIPKSAFIKKNSIFVEKKRPLWSCKSRSFYFSTLKSRWRIIAIILLRLTWLLSHCLFSYLAENRTAHFLAHEWDYNISELTLINQTSWKYLERRPGRSLLHICWWSCSISLKTRRRWWYLGGLLCQ